MRLLKIYRITRKESLLINNGQMGSTLTDFIRANIHVFLAILQKE